MSLILYILSSVPHLSSSAPHRIAQSKKCCLTPFSHHHHTFSSTCKVYLQSIQVSSSVLLAPGWSQYHLSPGLHPQSPTYSPWILSCHLSVSSPHRDQGKVNMVACLFTFHSPVPSATQWQFVQIDSLANICQMNERISLSSIIRPSIFKVYKHW